MRGHQKVIILGTVGKTPEMRYLPSGKAVVSFSVAVSEQWKDKNGQKQEATEWFNCSAFDKLAEIVGEYIDKGSKVYLEGTLHTRKWQDKNGQDRYTTEVKVSTMQMIEGKRDGQASAPANKPQPQASHDDFEDTSIPF